MSQVAKLHIRGSLVNITARQLTMAQLCESERVAGIAFNDPALAGSRAEFCASLAKTIGQEYKDTNTAMQEVLISFWMTSVDILYHRPKKMIIKILNNTCINCNAICLLGEIPIAKCACGSTARTQAPDDLIKLTTIELEEYYTKMTGRPAPERDYSIINNPIQRKKFFQTCLFNYLRQILRENTFAKVNAASKVYDYADAAIMKMIHSELMQTDISDDCAVKMTVKKALKSKALPVMPYTIVAPTLEIPLNVLKKIHSIIQHAHSNNILVKIVDCSIDNRLGTIVITPIGAPGMLAANAVERTRVHHVSLDTTAKNEEDGSFRDHIKSIADKMDHNSSIESADVDYCDSTLVVRERLSDNGKKVFDLITKAPDDYISKYGDRPCKAHIAAYLGLSQKEVQRQWEIIQLQMEAVGLTPRTR